MQLAQLNVARLLAPIDSPQLAGFVDQLDEINALAEASPGFVWRFEGDARLGNTSVPDDPLMLINLSVWRDVDALFAFTYQSLHKRPLGSRRDWFERPSGPHLVMWWVADGHRPRADEALARLALLGRDGPGPDAFDFRRRFDADGREAAAKPGAVAA
ncbi:hypothetical protein CJ010_02160 [Azoarcus sp. DD4]|uniref:DUF3291 domain-containing protein n=1 Tax=Azoarcus sp. DD4 TaxID=2027405 RepID=UPI00112815B4|nr:DUF3291 domain-containing protein [Azoarcus sp. DD4]QDF95440.1 hypothetical protein CJ010_02160 [Azoarcus sp. DD4]